jgi:hypothetical protein
MQGVPEWLMNGSSSNSGFRMCPALRLHSAMLITRPLQG